MFRSFWISSIRPSRDLNPLAFPQIRQSPTSLESPESIFLHNLNFECLDVSTPNAFEIVLDFWNWCLESAILPVLIIGPKWLQLLNEVLLYRSLSVFLSSWLAVFFLRTWFKNSPGRHVTQVLIPCMHQHACLTLERAEIFNASFYESTEYVVPRHPVLSICCPGFRVEVN